MKYATAAVEMHLRIPKRETTSPYFGEGAVSTSTGEILWEWFEEHIPQEELEQSKLLVVKQASIASLEAWRKIHNQQVNSPVLSNTLHRLITCLLCEKRPDLVGLQVIPLIERQLFALNTNCTGASESTASLLRDILNDPPSVLTPACVGLLRILLLPTGEGLNLRNMLWHGFLDQEDFAPEYAALTMSCWVSLQHVMPNLDMSMGSVALEPRIYEASGIQFLARLGSTVIESSAKLPWEGVKVKFPIRQHSASLGVSLVKQHSYVRSLIVLIPLVIEHGLRDVFQEYNRSELGPTPVTIADKGAYFTTLDGYGQRDRHHVMLCSQTMDGYPNSLLDKLPKGIVAALLDIFLHKDGPGLRSLIAHGYWSCESDYWSCESNTIDTSCVISARQQQQKKHQQTMSLCVVAIMVALCVELAQEDSRNEIPDIWIDIWEKVCQSYDSAFHPHAVVQTQISKFMQTMRELNDHLESRTLEFHTNDTNEDTWVKISISDEKDVNSIAVEYLVTWGKGTVQATAKQSETAQLLKANMDQLRNKVIDPMITNFGSFQNPELGTNHQSEIAANYREVWQTFTEAELLCRDLIHTIVSLESATMNRSARTSHRKSLVKALLLSPLAVSVMCFGCNLAYIGMKAVIAQRLSKAQQHQLSSALLAVNSFCQGLRTNHTEVTTGAKQDIEESVKQFCAAMNSKRNRTLFSVLPTACTAESDTNLTPGESKNLTLCPKPQRGDE